jgi:hypothetical protein
LSLFQSPHMYVIYSIPQLTFIIWGRRDHVRMIVQGPGGSMSYLVGLPNNSYKPITNTTWVRDRLCKFCKLQKGCTWLAAASDKVYQLLAHGRWFSPASSTTKTGRHDIAEILLKVTSNTKNSNRMVVWFTTTYAINAYRH